MIKAAEAALELILAGEQMPEDQPPPLSDADRREIIAALQAGRLPERFTITPKTDHRRTHRLHTTAPQIERSEQ